MSYQQITILGNLGRDPEMRYTQSGTPVASFSVATSQRWTTQDGNKQEKTVWFRVSAWRKLAELCEQYLAKGRQVMVVGEMEEPHVFQDKSGEYRSSLELTARTIQFLGGRGESTGSPDHSSQSLDLDNVESVPW